MTAAFALRILPENAGRIERVLNNLRRRGADHKKLLGAVGALVETQTKKRLASGGPSPSGEKWADWSWDYAASWHGRRPEEHPPHPGRRRSAGGHTILHLEGDMRDSIINVVEWSEVAIGPTVEYASAHQFGIGVPKREFMGLSGSDVDEIEDELNAWAKAAGGGLLQ